jgi:hypothetical protein
MSHGRSASNLQRSKVERAEETEHAATLHFSDGRSLRIGLRDEAQEGSEALDLCRPGEPTVVWD